MRAFHPDPGTYRDLVRRALDEDLGGRADISTEATVPPAAPAVGRFVAKADCVLAGIDVACECFRVLQPDVLVAARKLDGEACRAGDVVAVVSGSARTLLIGERTALNFLQRLSGIATLTRQFVDAAGGRIIVLDTRKTTPTLRALEKYAVRVGGGCNHRFGLFDQLLIKDNHIALAGGVRQAVARARAQHPALAVEVEADTLEQITEALEAGAETILLDNMTTAEICEAVRRNGGRAKLEISGGVTLERMPELAATGADSVSIGALTHSAPAVDISFEIEPNEEPRKHEIGATRK